MNAADAAALLLVLGPRLAWRRLSEHDWAGKDGDVSYRITLVDFDPDLYLAHKADSDCQDYGSNFEEAKAACERHHATGKWAAGSPPAVQALRALAEGAQLQWTETQPGDCWISEFFGPRRNQWYRVVFAPDTGFYLAAVDADFSDTPHSAHELYGNEKVAKAACERHYTTGQWD